MVKFRIIVIMGCVVVKFASHLCDVFFWPSPVLSLHPVLEQQQKTRNINVIIRLTYKLQCEGMQCYRKS